MVRKCPQLYIYYPKAAYQPVSQLPGFENMEIKKGQQSEVRFNLRCRDISYWDIKAQNWVVTPGSYHVYVGASSRDLRKRGSFTVHSK